MGFLSDLFGPTTQTSTTTSQGTNYGSSSGSTSGSSSSTPTLSPELQAVMQQLLGHAQQQMNDPTAAMAPIRNAGLQNINQTYADVPNQVASQMSRRGYGSSGSMGDSMYKVGLARAGAASDLEGQLATKGIDQQNRGADTMTQLLNMLKGTSSTSSGSMSGTTAGTSSSSGTSTKPGPSIFSSIAGLAGMLMGFRSGAGVGGGGGDSGDSGVYGGGSAGPTGGYNNFSGPNPVGTATGGF